MYKALAGTPANNSTALDNNTRTRLQSNGDLSVNAAAGAGSLPDATDPGSVTLKATDHTVTALDGWKGKDYSLTSGTGNAKVTNEARLYYNQGAPKTQPFSGTDGKYTLISGKTGDQKIQNGYLASGNEVAMVGAGSSNDISLLRADAFNHQGTKNHPYSSPNDALYVRGTYDGAPGQFRCTGTCTSTNDGSGAPSALGGVWWFKPDADAMVSTPDAHYLYFGWWVSKDSDGPTAASAFMGRFGTDGAGDSLDAAWPEAYVSTAGSETITGSATYDGHAAGKYAFKNPLDGTGHAGHFTADAMLEAKFSGTDPGVKGTIDNFRLNDESADPNWSVSLHLVPFGTGGRISKPTDDGATANVNEALATMWSINGNDAHASGTWSGMMYDEKPAMPRMETAATSQPP